MAAAGRRLVALNAYEHRGETHFAAVASAAASPAHRASHDLSPADLERRSGGFSEREYRMRVITGHASGPSTRYAALPR